MFKTNIDLISDSNFVYIFGKRINTNDIEKIVIDEYGITTVVGLKDGTVYEYSKICNKVFTHKF